MPKFTSTMNSASTHNLNPEFQLTKLVETLVGNYFFYGNIVVFEAKEGILLSYKKEFPMLLNALDSIKNEPWCYVSNRINSYAIQTADYKYLNTLSTLKAFGIVCYSAISYSNAILESKFCKKPFQIFNDLSNAVIWGKSLL